MYEYDFRVSLSQSDDRHMMAVTSIIDVFQDCSCFHSDDIGVGFDYLRPKNLVWVINYWELDILRTPDYGEKLTVGTFSYDFKGFLGYRNFYLRSGDEYLVKANSMWTLMDWNNMRPTKVTPEMTAAYINEEKLNMSYNSRKITLPEGDSVDITHSDGIVIMRHHLDCNGHVNNGQYVKLAFGALDNISDIAHMRVEYRSQAHLGDRIDPVIYHQDNTYTVCLNKEDGSAYCVTEFTCR